MMPTSLMVYLAPGAEVASLLQLASDVAARLNARRIVGISALRPLQIYAGPDAYVPQEFIEQDWASMEKELRIAEQRLRAAFAGKAVELEWRSAVTIDPVSDYVGPQMRAVDLLITAPTPSGLLFDTNRYLNVADLVLKAGRPVLVADSGVTKLDLDNVLIGWNDSREARRAAEDALPILRMAGKVTVVEVADADTMSEAGTHVKDVVEWLEVHDIAAQARVERGGDEDAVVLAELARDLKAGLLVAGAYGHSRLREWVLGGVTRDLLMRPTQCSFVSH
ncbi:MAG: universal stress protein [Proteobacteria bacterium]|nr:universal stress protein [Pseudomonadota bacterium]